MQESFIKFALEKKVLQFGDFTTKAGRKSPYFFNLSSFNDGDSLKILGDYYAEKIIEENIKFDLLFGPAYKGISLVGAIAISLSNKGINKKFSSNRKEIKDHGEGGNIIGSDPIGDVMIIDDVLSAGTAARESIELIKNTGANPKSFIVGLDRQEKGSGELSASNELAKDFGINVISIVNLDTLISFSENNPDHKKYLAELRGYRENWGA